MKVLVRRRRRALLAVLGAVAVIASVFAWTLTGQALTVPAKQDFIWMAAPQACNGAASGSGSDSGNTFGFDVTCSGGVVTPGSYVYYYDNGGYNGYELTNSTVTTLAVKSNRATFSGTGQLWQAGQVVANVSYSVSVVDKGSGATDTFRIDWTAGKGSYSFHSKTLLGTITVTGG